MRAEKIDGMLWMVSRGTGKIRFGSSAPDEFQLLGSFSSNGGFMNEIEMSSPERADALADRLLTIPIGGDRPYGVFDFIPDEYDGSVQFAASIEAGMTANYGIAMPAYLQQLVQLRYDDLDALVARIRRHIEGFCRRVGVGSNDGSAYRVAQVFGVIGTAGLLAIDLGVLPEDFDPLESAAACYYLYHAGCRERLSIADRLSAIAANPATVDLDGGLPALSDDELKEVSAFRKTADEGPQLWLTRAQRQRHFPDWKSIWKSAEMEAVLVAQSGRKGNAGRIRKGKKLDRLYRFSLPT